MRADRHMAKARRLEESVRGKLDLGDDAELIIWGCIHGGAQLLNVMFHRHGFTADGDDMIHTWVPELTRPVPAQLAEFVDTLKRIEALGPRHVRGFEPCPADVVAACLADFRRLKAIAAGALGEVAGA